MQTKAIRLHGAGDVRLDSFELPVMKDDEILAHIISNSICMSTHKAVLQGAAHKRVHDDVSEHPAIMGHEMCGEIVAVGSKWAGRYQPGQKFTLQTSLNYHGTLWAPGYSYEYVGGNATYVLIPPEVMELDCLLPYCGEEYFYGSLSEPMSCVIGAFHANYHIKPSSYHHDMGIREGGAVALLGAVGPMGFGAIDYALNGPVKPSLLVVTGTRREKLERARRLYPEAEAAEKGIRLVYFNVREDPDAERKMMELTGGRGYDDVFCFVPAEDITEQADRLLAVDGCLNFFAGPTDKNFSARLNYYNVHYAGHHLAANSGGTTDDMREALDLMGRGIIRPVSMITHIGGLDAAPDTILHLHDIPGGKKLIYTNKKLPLTAISDLAELGKSDPFYARLAEICEAHNGLWSMEAEKYLLANAPEI